MGRLRFLIALAALAALLLAAPVAAPAAVRFATPNGATFGDCTTSSTLSPKCRIDRAVAVAKFGDSVALDGGTYTLSSTLVIGTAITMQPVARASTPIIKLTAPAKDTVQVASGAAGTNISGIEMDNVNTDAVGPASAVRTLGSAHLVNVIMNAHGPSGPANVSALLADANTTLQSAGVSVSNSGGALDAVQSDSGVSLTLSNVSILTDEGNHLRAAIGGNGNLDASDISLTTQGDQCINVSSPSVTLRNITAVQNASASGPVGAACVAVSGGARVVGLRVTASSEPADADAVIFAAASRQGGISVTDVSVRTTGVAALLSGDPSSSLTVRRATLHGASGARVTGSRIGTGGPSVLLTDSVLTASGTGTAAASAESGATLLLRHSDAIGSTRGSAALRVAGCTGNVFTCSGGAASLDAQDVIARAGGATLVLSATCNTACSGPVASMSLNHSNFNPASVSRVGPAGASALTLGARNQDRRTTPPVLIDGVHQAASSPTVDHGAPYDRMASSDIDGNPRTVGAATDIGADELVP